MHQADKDQQRREQDKPIHACDVRYAWQEHIDGEQIGHKGEKRRGGDTDVGANSCPEVRLPIEEIDNRLILTFGEMPKKGKSGAMKSGSRSRYAGLPDNQQEFSAARQAARKRSPPAKTNSRARCQKESSNLS